MHRQIAGKLTSPVTKWVVLAAVILLTMVMGGLGSKLADVKNNEQSSWVPSSAESTRVADQLSKEVNPNDIPTLVAYHRSSGLTEADLAAIDEQGAQIAKIDGVTKAGVLTPNGAAALQAQGQNVPTLLSDDGQVAYVYFTFNMGKDGWNKIKDPVDEIKDITAMDGVDVYVGGFGGQAYDFISSFDGSHVTLLAMTFLVVILILLFTYRSAVLWILPILSAAVANTMAGGVVYLLAKYAGLVVNDQSQYILSILVIGAGTDYALLLVARYREELRRHEDRHEAMAVALHRAAPAIIASAATVVVGLMCLSFADLNSTASLGPVLAVGVAVTLLVMVTFLPALLVIVGRWVFGPQREHQRTWVKVGIGEIVGGIAAVAVGAALKSVSDGLGIALTVVGAFAAFIGILVLVQVGIEHWTKVHSRPDFGSVEPTQSGLWARVGDRIKVRPRQVWVGTAVILAVACLGLFKLDANGLSTEDSFTETLDSVTAQKLLADHDLADNSNTIQVVANDDELGPVQDSLTGMDALGTPTDPTSIGDGRSYFEVPIKYDLASQSAFDLVVEARDRVHAVDGADALVGGGAAFYLDTKTASQRDNKVVIPLVLLVVLVILVLLLRALTAPLLLIGTVILSFGAALGLSSLLFHYVFGFAGADAGFPLFAFVFLVALGVDYNIFLMTRVREESAQHGTRRGSLIALSSTGGVITSAGLVLASTFLVLATLPFVFLVELGTAVALGVLLDTMIVRSVLVTALNLDLGAKIWWPSKLDSGQGEADPGTPEPERESVSV
jgi:RND superfamily putative drug exporter